MNCFICGNVANKTLSPDMDIFGIPLCSDGDCAQLLALILLSETDENKVQKRLLKIRKDRHKKAGNPWNS
jgi:hypothetical protein